MSVDTHGVRSDIQTLMQDHLSSHAVSVLAPRLVLLNFIAMRDGDKTGIYGLGRPKVDGKANGVLVSGNEVARARKEEIFGSLTYQPMIQYKLPSAADGKVITSLADNEPKRSSWEGNRTEQMFKRPVFRWFVRSEPGKVSKMSLRMTRSAAKDDALAAEAIGGLLTAETKSVLTVHAIELNKRLIGLDCSATGSATQGAPTNADADFYDNLYSIKDSCKNNNSYAGIDRSVAGNEWWQGNYVTTGTTKSFEDLINDVKYAQTNTISGNTSLANFGLNVDLCIVGNSLFVKAIAEGRQKNVQPIFNGSTPEFAEFGINNDVVRIGRTWIVNEPSFPSTEAAFLSLDTWTVAVHPQANFTVSEPADQTKVEGGDRALTFTIESQLMVACEWPAGNAYYTTVS